MIDYKQKYLKYKMKYLTAKRNLQSGGAATFDERKKLILKQIKDMRESTENMKLNLVPTGNDYLNKLSSLTERLTELSQSKNNVVTKKQKKEIHGYNKILYPKYREMGTAPRLYDLFLYDLDFLEKQIDSSITESEKKLKELQEEFNTKILKSDKLSFYNITTEYLEGIAHSLLPIEINLQIDKLQQQKNKDIENDQNIDIKERKKILDKQIQDVKNLPLEKTDYKNMNDILLYEGSQLALPVAPVALQEV